MAAIFELDAIRFEPFWAQVLLASRTVRRAGLSMRELIPPEELEIRLRGCDLVDEAARQGGLGERLPLMKAAVNHPGSAAGEPLRQALFWAVDAADAANSTGDFTAAERACVNSSGQAVAHAMAVPTMTPLQVRICLAGDFEQVRHACREGRVGRYDGLGTYVFERLAPVYPPEIVRPSRSGSPTEDECR
jgi:hypothetical protein